MSSPEQLPQGAENGVEAPHVSAEHYERLENKNELGEHLKEHESAEKQESKARAEALENAVSVERGGAEKYHNPATDAPRRRGAISKKEKNVAYKKHVAQIQAEMKPSQRAFSKVLHNPVVEKTSEALGDTVARPNAILAGSIAAFVLVLIVFLVANHFGYALSGFETIAAFVAGWILGLLYDFFKVMITGKKA